jgi:hypothetical protein
MMAVARHRWAVCGPGEAGERAPRWPRTQVGIGGDSHIQRVLPPGERAGTAHVPAVIVAGFHDDRPGRGGDDGSAVDDGAIPEGEVCEVRLGQPGQRGERMLGLFPAQ